jgi:Domain of unknown function (DUF4395)
VNPSSAASGAAVLIDARGPRFGAALTTVVLAVVLLTIPSAASGVLLALQTVVFGVGAFLGLRYAPYGWIFRTLVRPRLGPPSDLEEEPPPRFAQAVGFGFATVGLLALLLGWTALAYLAVGMALVAAFLNAAFGYCLGCEMYLLLRRVSAG